MSLPPLSFQVLPENVTADLSATFQRIALTHVEDRVARAMTYFEREIGSSVSPGSQPLSLVVVGGVAANQELRSRLLHVIEKANIANIKLSKYRKTLQNKEETPIEIEPIQWRLVFPPPELCTDNGVMAAWAGIEKLSRGISDEIAGQEAIARWPIGLAIDRKNGVFRKRDA